MTTLVVTRPQPDAALWVQQLRAQGVDACALPMMRIGPSQSAAAVNAVQAALDQLDSYQVLMFVSGNAVRYFFELLRQHKHTLPQGLQYWSPGPGTSKALLCEGISPLSLIQPALDAQQFDSESLWEQAQKRISTGDRVLIVRGGDGQQSQGQGRQWLTEQLRQRGAHVDFAPVYERLAPIVTPALLAEIAALRERQAAWLFSSSECLQHLVHCNHDWTWQSHTALATHPRIADQARKAGFGRVMETQPSVLSITASIESLHDHS